MNLKVGTVLRLKKPETPCQHGSRMTIQAGGVERHICESCGHVSFEFADQGYDEVDRRRFARSIDQSES